MSSFNHSLVVKKYNWRGLSRCAIVAVPFEMISLRRKASQFFSSPVPFVLYRISIAFFVSSFTPLQFFLLDFPHLLGSFSG